MIDIQEQICSSSCLKVTSALLPNVEIKTDGWIRINGVFVTFLSIFMTDRAEIFEMWMNSILDDSVIILRAEG